MTSIHPEYEWINLTPGEGHFTYGYYDRCPWDAENRHHLAIQIPQQDHLPEPGDTCTVGVLDPEARSFTPVTQTAAWCHQVGALTQWVTNEPGCIAFNDYREEGGHLIPVTRIWHLDKGHQRDIDGHNYSISPDGKYMSVIDYARIPRRGYAFADTPRPAEPQPTDLDAEGFGIMEVATGERVSFTSYRQIFEAHPRAYGLPGARLWINQGTFNVDSSRAMFIFRSTHDEASSWPWQTDLFTVNVDGSDLRCTLPYPYWKGSISHQVWGRTPEEMLLDANWFDQGSQYIVIDETQHPLKAQKISDGQHRAGHLNFSSDGRYLAGDTYATEDGIQHLVLVEVATDRMVEIGQFKHSEPGVEGDLRCDLHPRWCRESRRITVDTIHEGARKIYMLDVNQVKF